MRFFESDREMEGSIFNDDKRIKTAVIQALCYYSSFRLPMKAQEIYHNMPGGCSLSKLLVVLEDLTDSYEIFKYNGYYSLDPDVKQLVMQRHISCN